MARMKMVSGVVHYVKVIAKTAEFYGKLGFIILDQDKNTLTVRLNWFWIKFIVDDKEAPEELRVEKEAEFKGAGQYIAITVDDVDEFYDEVLAKGIKVATGILDMKSGSREFIVRDPDGYKLVFFTKSNK